jgi:hypothetical protein
MKEADAAEGFIARSVLNLETLRQSWGDPVRPSFVPPEREAMIQQTLSIWADLESVYAFAYSTPIHSEALRMREDWFHAPDHPNYAAWWVADDHRISFQEGTDRLEALHARGPTPEAFNFKQPFDALGQPVRLDPAIVKAKAARNAAARENA